jgi:RHS repeat-associated protein
MLGSSFFDLMLGVDIHWELVPMPAPVPTPIPNPFTGIVKDFTGLAVGLALSNAIGACMGGSLKGPVLYWGVIPATNTGTNGEHVPGHILIPPGTGWAPVPKTPKPVVRPNETPKPPKPVSPDNDAIIVVGSKTVTVLGTNAVRMGDIAMSCSEPIRLPSTVVVAVPKGRPILIGGPMHLDVMAAILASLRTRFIGDSLQAGISRLPIGARGRAVLSWLACALTGHPVDVASGKMMTRAIDAELPGPLPLTIERFYLSNFASRRGPLGCGWSCSLDQAVWQERGKMVLLAEDGREIEFDTFDFPDRRMRPGDEVWNPINRLTLRYEAQGKWRVTSHDGVYREFSALHGSTDGRARIQRIVSRGENHDITFMYDGRGRLEWVRDSAGRVIWLEHDELDRIVALKLPNPDEPGWYVHRRYEYDSEGDLVRATDSLGNTWSFEYVTHLMVRETDRTGLRFYFEYDGLGEDAWCTRTWGDGGIYDHVINYDKKNHVTYVTNSLGHTTQYYLNNVGLVTRFVDPMGGEEKFKYDENFRKISEVNSLGKETQFDYDNRGNQTKTIRPDGISIGWKYDHMNNPIEVTDEGGFVWIAEYDNLGQLIATTDPISQSTTYRYSEGLLRSIHEPSGASTLIEYDAHVNIGRVYLSDGPTVTMEHDGLGRTIRFETDGDSETCRYDSENRLVFLQRADGLVKVFTHDGEGYVTSEKDQLRSLSLRYAGFHWLAELDEEARTLELGYDLEGRLIRVQNPAGEAHLLERDLCGRVTLERGFGGETYRYRLDKSGRTVEVTQPDETTVKLAYDDAGRLTRADYPGESWVAFTRRPDGAVVGVTNESHQVTLERDPLGHVTREQVDEDVWIRSQYRYGARVRMESAREIVVDVTRNVAGDATVVKASAAGSRPHIDEFRRDQWGLALSRSSGLVRERVSHNSLGFVASQVVSTSHTLLDRLYDWGPDAILNSIADRSRGTRVFEHDRHGRLVSAKFEDGELQFRSPDIASNVYATPDRHDRDYAPGGRLVAIGSVRLEYDALGRLERKVLPDGSAWQYQYDGRGNLQEVKAPDGRRTRYRYDGLARRTQKEVDGRVTNFVWDGNELLHQIDSDTSLVTWISDGSVSKGSPITRLDSDGAYAIIRDQVGFPQLIVDDDGTVVWDAQVDLYGHPQVHNANKPIPDRWPGQYADDETGLYYNRFRYYDPDTGLYICPDPMGLAGGIYPYAYPFDPLAWMDWLALVFGLYTFVEAAGTYIGSSVDTVRRLGEHVRAGRIAAREAATETAVDVFGATGRDGRRLLRLAEQEAIVAAGGIGALTNEINAVGARLEFYKKLRDWYKNDKEGPKPKCG